MLSQIIQILINIATTLLNNVFIVVIVKDLLI